MILIFSDEESPSSSSACAAKVTGEEALFFIDNDLVSDFIECSPSSSPLSSSQNLISSSQNIEYQRSVLYYFYRWLWEELGLFFLFLAHNKS